MERKKHNEESGFILVIVIVLLGIAVIIASGGIALSATSLRHSYAWEQRTAKFIQAESALYKALDWFRDNSTSLYDPFQRSSFYTNFGRSTPGFGSNDSSSYQIASRLRIKTGGTLTTKVGLLNNNSTLGTTEYNNGASAFNPITSFNSTLTNLVGGVKVRATLIDAIAVDPSKDYGEPPAATPQTDFYPIYRVDAMHDLDSGAHVYAYLIGSLNLTDVVGFYGHTGVELRQNCDSYNSADGAYGGTNKRAKCPVGSNATVQVHQNSKIYGSVRTNGAINTGAPFGGSVCADFVSGCPNAGTICQGATCAVPGIATYSTFATYCPTNQGNLTINSNQTLTVAGNAANQKCWGTVTINAKKQLTLTSTSFPYFFNTLSIANNGKLNIQPSPASGVVTVYVNTWSGNNFNGNQVLNTANRPSQLKLIYLGASALTLNGNAQANASIIAPNATFNLQGSFVFQGGILANSLTATGSADIHYDESLGGTIVSDMTLRPRGFQQRYR